jgi:hypothetical protein
MLRGGIQAHPGSWIVTCTRAARDQLGDHYVVSDLNTRVHIARCLLQWWRHAQDACSLMLTQESAEFHPNQGGETSKRQARSGNTLFRIPHR